MRKGHFNHRFKGADFGENQNDRFNLSHGQLLKKPVDFFQDFVLMLGSMAGKEQIPEYYQQYAFPVKDGVCLQRIFRSDKAEQWFCKENLTYSVSISRFFVLPA